MAAVIQPLPPTAAIAALRRRGRVLDPSFAWQDRWQDDHAAMFTVAKSTGFDVLKDIHGALEAALSEGRTPRDFAKNLTPVLQEKGWWGRRSVLDPETGEMVSAQLGSPRRLKTIFDANMRVSYAAGHWESFEQNKAARPFLRYVAILDDRTRPEHRALHNLVLPVDHPTWNVWAPPCGWNCRCTLQSLSQRDVDRLVGEGELLTFEPPQIEMREWTNRRTGEVQWIPEGIDPGWAHNPGKAGYEAGLKQAEKLVDAPPDLAALFNEDQDWLARPVGEEFASWFDQAAAGGRVERSTVVAGTLSRDVLDALAARSMKPASGAITVDQRAVRHMLRDTKDRLGTAAPAQVLRTMPELLASPRAVVLDLRDNSLVYVFDVPGEERFGKLAVRINHSRQVRPPGGRSQRIETNAVRTAGLVEERVLTDTNFYQLVSGTL